MFDGQSARQIADFVIHLKTTVDYFQKWGKSNTIDYLMIGLNVLWDMREQNLRDFASPGLFTFELKYLPNNH